MTIEVSQQSEDVAAQSAPDATLPKPLVHRHIKALDGLRGTAILMVLACHFIPFRATPLIAGRLLNGVVGFGWVGVDLFFVLSGFLITGILLEAKGTEHYFRNFYARRTLRIFPLYYLAIFACTVVFPRLGVFADAAPVGRSWWWWLYLSNFRWALMPKLSMGWLTFFWSLAVEEHFYLVWPAVIFLCRRKTAMRISAVCMLVAWLSRGLCILAHNEIAPYVLTPCRMDALAIGAFVALAAQAPGGLESLLPLGKRLFWISGPLALLAGFWRHSIPWDPVMQMVGYPLIDLAFAGLLILAAAPYASGWLRQIFELKLLRTFGKYSYGIYVFHGAVAVTLLASPILQWRLFPERLRRADDAAKFLVLTAASLAIAFMSWHLFEKHFLRLKRFFEYRAAIPGSSNAGNDVEYGETTRAKVIESPRAPACT